MSSGITAVVIEPPEEGKVTIRKTTVEGESLPFLQKAVGGYIEHLFSEDRKTDFWMNEEAKLEGLPVNGVASEVLYQLHPVFRGRDVLCGTVVLTGNKGPETDSVPAATWEWLKAFSWPAHLNIEFIEEQQ